MVNTKRKMSTLQIDKAFNDMILRGDAVMLADFVEYYPHFVERYVRSLLNRLQLINMVTAGIRENE